ncbi:MAG: TerB family tellurite resistance protein [Nitrospira sp.]|nr:TerB family tellurite resistance protein [Nitrospira sp.]
MQPFDEGEPLPVKRIAISGVIGVPTRNHPVQFRVRLLDVTESESDPAPILCLIDQIADENGCFDFRQRTHIPYEFAEVIKMPILGIPLFAIAGPRRGRRRVKVLVAVTAEHSLEPVFAFGEATFTYEQQLLGYLEKHERTKAYEQQIATLAIALSAADGNLGAGEAEIIHRFFADYLEGQAEANRRHLEIQQAMDDAVARLRNKTETVSQVIKRLCAEMQADGDPTVAQVAYELCVRVVASDNKVHERERVALAYIARELNLPEQFVRETHERMLRISMYQDNSDEKILGIPDRLSDDQKREFLNKEYGKWKARVTHKDPKVAAEASMRLEIIARVRSKLHV